MRQAPTARVWVVTAHGRRELLGERSERIIDLLARHQVPWSAVSTYAAVDGAAPRLVAALDQPLSSFGENSELLIYFNRNVNPFLFSPHAYRTITEAEPAEFATEYLYQRMDNAQGTTETWLKRLSPDECRQIVAERVAETIEAHIPANADLVVGVSGGGDSNALLDALSRLRSKIRVHPTLIKGIPDWDAGAPRAIALCDKYGFELDIVGEESVRELLGIPPRGRTLVERFEAVFPGDDFEFLGTLLIRLALSRRASQLGTPFICTGLNLEDLLCEALFRTSNGLRPAPFPLRSIGDVQLVYPLWMCPKRIIDGCFPNYSRENYDARYPCFSLGRNLYYSVVFALQSQFPGFPEQLAKGMSLEASRDPVHYFFDSGLGFHVERHAPLPIRQQFLRMLRE